jgi:hypothetical protein
LHVEGVDVPDRFVLLLADGTGGPRSRLARIDDTAGASEATGA